MIIDLLIFCYSLGWVLVAGLCLYAKPGEEMKLKYFLWVLFGWPLTLSLILIFGVPFFISTHAEDVIWRKGEQP